MKDINIVVVTNGFVHVGKILQIDGYIQITNAMNIRAWGTSRGLGQLALEGPQPNTILDRCGVIRVPLQSVVFLIECKEDKWQQHLA